MATFVDITSKGVKQAQEVILMVCYKANKIISVTFIVVLFTLIIESPKHFIHHLASLFFINFRACSSGARELSNE